MRILLFDADQSACDLLVRTLRDYFPEHTWLTAFSYDEGLQVAQQAGRLDFVLADLRTNEAGGPSLAHLIEGMHPRAQIYFLGSYAQETTFFRARPGRIFPKPVNVHKVVAALHLAEENLTLHEKPAGETVAEPASLAKMNRLIAHEGFSGQLAQFQLHEIVQLCCLGQRTGRMSVTKGDETGAIYFYNGKVLHAECGGLQGEDAVMQIIGWKSGQFAFADGILADRETIQTSWDFLLLEAMRKLDESNAGTLAVRAELKPGQCFGPYQLVRLLAVREQEQVYEAQLSQSGLVLTLCVLPASLTHQSAPVKQFVAEASAKSELDSPIFLRATKAAQTEGVFYYTLELISGLTLEDFGGDRLLAEGQVLEVLRSVGRAMSDLQAQHLVHHPLSPRDVWIDVRGQVRITNLASLRPAEGESVAGQIGKLAGRLRQALGPAGIRSGGLKSVFRRMERSGPDRIATWASLRKAVEGVSLSTLLGPAHSPSGANEHTSFIVNLVPDRPTLGVLKLAAAAGLAGLLVGSIFWVTGRFDHVTARQPAVGDLMAAEVSTGAAGAVSTSNVAVAASFVATNAPNSAPLAHGSNPTGATVPFVPSKQP